MLGEDPGVAILERLMRAMCWERILKASMLCRKEVAGVSAMRMFTSGFPICVREALLKGLQWKDLGKHWGKSAIIERRIFDRWLW